MLSQVREFMAGAADLPRGDLTRIRQPGKVSCQDAHHARTPSAGQPGQLALLFVRQDDLRGNSHSLARMQINVEHRSGPIRIRFIAGETLH